jgi:hypothetical protein
MTTALTLPSTCRDRPSFATSINDQSEVAGTYSTSGVLGILGFVYLTTVDVPGAPTTAPLAISNRSEVVGIYLDANGRQHGFEATPSGKGSDPSLSELMAGQTSAVSTSDLLAGSSIAVSHLKAA